MDRNNVKHTIFYTSVLMMYIGLIEFIIFNQKEDESVRAFCIIGLTIIIMAFLALTFLFVLDIIDKITATKGKRSVRMSKKKKSEVYEIFDKDFMLFGNYDVSIVRAIKGKFIEFTSIDTISISITGSDDLKIGCFDDALVYTGLNSNSNYFDFNLGLRLCNKKNFRQAVEEVGNGIVIAFGKDDCVAAVVNNKIIGNTCIFYIDDKFKEFIMEVCMLAKDDTISTDNLTLKCIEPMGKDALSYEITCDILRAVSYKCKENEDDMYWP